MNQNNWEWSVMRTTVKASCASCGNDVTLGINDVTVRILTGHEKEENGQQYRFRCPICGKINLKETTVYIISTLVSAGARKETWDLPLELMEHPREDIQPPITLDDIIDFHVEIENSEEWMKKMRGEE